MKTLKNNAEKKKNFLFFTKINKEKIGQNLSNVPIQINNNFIIFDLKKIIRLINININKSVEYLSIKIKLVVEKKKINKKTLL